MSEDTPQTIGPYRILEPLGRGGMGVVYRAQHLETGLHAALKTVRVPQQVLLQGIRREIHALSRLKHPGIIRVVDHGVEQNLPWYAMELVHGTTLYEYVSGRIQEAIPTSAASGWWTTALGQPSAGQTPAAPASTTAQPPSVTLQQPHPFAALPPESTRLGPLQPSSGSGPVTDTPALPSLPETGAILEALPLLLTVVRRLCTHTLRHLLQL